MTITTEELKISITTLEIAKLMKEHNFKFVFTPNQGSTNYAIVISDKNNLEDGIKFGIGHEEEIGKEIMEENANFLKERIKYRKNNSYEKEKIEESEKMYSVVKKLHGVFKRNDSLITQATNNNSLQIFVSYKSNNIAINALVATYNINKNQPQFVFGTDEILSKYKMENH